LANFITYTRMFFTIPIGLALYRGMFNAALMLFVVAALTDWLDGFVARRTGTVSEVGKVMDQIADKVLVNSVAVFLLDLGLVPSWLVISLIWRDLMVSAVRILAAKSGRVIAANVYGKLKTVFQMALFITLLSRNLFRSPLLEEVLIWTVLFLTLLSMTVYIWENRSVLKT